jgi:hypothetical protein
LWLEDDFEDFKPSSEREEQLYLYYNYAAERLIDEEKAFLKDVHWLFPLSVVILKPYVCMVRQNP